MTNVEFIETVLSSGLLIKELTYIPLQGASLDELINLDTNLIRPLSQPHKDILQKWNGLNLDVIRIFGATPTSGELKGLTEVQDTVLARGGNIVFADDPAGFMYVEDIEGGIWSIDIQSDNKSLVSQNMDDFFKSYLFGSKASAFGGESWIDELRAAKLI